METGDGSSSPVSEFPEKGDKEPSPVSTFSLFFQEYPGKLRYLKPAGKQIALTQE